MVKAAVVVNESAIQVLKADGGIRSFIVKNRLSRWISSQVRFRFNLLTASTHKCPGLKSAHKNMQMEKMFRARGNKPAFSTVHFDANRSTC